MEKNKILIYGANGYMGQLFLKMAQSENFDLVLGARTNVASDIPVRVFTLENINNVCKHLDDVKLFINLAGPFNNTNKQIVEACIQSGTHYVDIAGEVPELETVFKFNESAIKAGIMLLPGAGFGVVPTDIVACLAKEKLPNATHLKIAYITNGGASRGTLKTVLADINKDGVILEHNTYKKAKPAFKNFSIHVNN